MNAIFTILVVLIVIASILLTIVVLLQNGKGDSMASNFVAGNQTFGVRQTANMLEKITWGLVSFIVVVSIISSFTMGSKDALVDITNKIENVATEQPEFPSAVQQSAPAVQADPASASDSAK